MNAVRRRVKPFRPGEIKNEGFETDEADRADAADRSVRREGASMLTQRLFF